MIGTILEDGEHSNEKKNNLKNCLYNNYVLMKETVNLQDI